MYTTVQSDNRMKRDQRKIVAFTLTRPVLQSSAGAERINGFLEAFVSAYQGWIESDLIKDLTARYESADRAERIHRFPADVRLHCLCRESDDFFSAHFVAEVSVGEETDARCASFVWNTASGELLRLSDLTGKAFAAARRGWRFYLASDGLRIYRVNRHGKIVKREKYPQEKYRQEKDPDIKTETSS